MSKIKDLQAQIAALQAQVEEVKKTEVADAITKIRAIVEEYDLKASDIFEVKTRKSSSTREPKAAGKRGVVAAKYKDPISGKTWSGRGRTPLWLDGKNKEDFVV